MGSCCPTASWICKNTLQLERNMHHRKRRESEGLGLAYPTRCPPPQACQFCLLQPTCTVRTTRSSPKTANLFLLKEGTHSVFHWYEHLAIILVPSISLEDSIKRLEALQNSLLLLLLSRFSRVQLCVTP